LRRIGEHLNNNLLILGFSCVGLILSYLRRGIAFARRPASSVDTSRT
jgi:hypothetical protein